MSAAEAEALGEAAAAGGRLRAGRGDRHRHRHAAGDHGQDLRAVLHHQGGRQGHRARPVDGLRHRQADRRLHLLRQRGRARAPPSASSCRGTSPSRGASRPVEPRPSPRPSPPTSPGTAPSCWSRTRMRCAPSARARSASAATPCCEAASGVEALEVIDEPRRHDRPRRLRRGHAGDGRADPAARAAQAPARPQGDLRLRLCRGRLPQEPAGRASSSPSCPSPSP